MIAWLNFVGTYSMPFLTLALVLVTTYYAYQTRQTVKEMVITRKHQFLPSLRVEPTRLFLGDSFDIEIVNIGLGPAKNIHGKIKLEPNGGQIEIVYPLLYPQEKFALHSPLKEIKDYNDVKKYSKLILSATFEDISNTTHNNHDTFLIEDLERIKNDDYPRDRIVDSLRDIERKLDAIKDAIKSWK